MDPLERHKSRYKENNSPPHHLNSHQNTLATPIRNTSKNPTFTQTQPINHNRQGSPSKSYFSVYDRSTMKQEVKEIQRNVRELILRINQADLRDLQLSRLVKSQSMIGRNMKDNTKQQYIPDEEQGEVFIYQQPGLSSRDINLKGLIQKVDDIDAQITDIQSIRQEEQEAMKQKEIERMRKLLEDLDREKLQTQQFEEIKKRVSDDELIERKDTKQLKYLIYEIMRILGIDVSKKGKQGVNYTNTSDTDRVILSEKRNETSRSGSASSQRTQQVQFHTKAPWTSEIEQVTHQLNDKNKQDK
ncbi:MAG: hypothetical protein EZS28_001324, partial [Streblomastix strix]